MTIKATARIQITVEIDGSFPWGPYCTIGQLHKQAAEDGLKNLQNALKPGTMAGAPNIRLVGAPKVTGIITKED